MAAIDEWIAEEFSGHGVAVRRQDQPPISGEPFMSMQVAKHFAKLAYELGQREAAEELKRLRGLVSQFTSNA